VAEDTSPGRHDTLYAACDPERYALPISAGGITPLELRVDGG
jgi:hypothetical protein